MSILIRVILTIVLLIVAAYLFLVGLLFNSNFAAGQADGHDRLVGYITGIGGLMCLGAIFLIFKKRK